MFTAGNVCLFVFRLVGAQSPGAVAGVLWVMYALTQTFGLVLIAIADIDINRFMKRNRIRAVRLLVAFLVFEVILGGMSLVKYGNKAKLNSIHVLHVNPHRTIWALACIQALPLGYLFLRFSSVFNMKERYPLFSELFLVMLGLDLTSNYGVSIMLVDTLALEEPKFKGSRPITKVASFSAGLCIAGALLMMFLYMRRRRRGESPTLALKASILCYLLTLGVTNLIGRIANKVPQWDGKKTPDAFLLYGPIHIIPCVAFLFNGRCLYRFVGKSWLKSRLGATETELFTLEDAGRGNLVEVEEAIKVGADLNAFVLSTKLDDYTLLHLAVLNEHHDSVQRLLHTGEVQADKPSGSKGRTALFLAAELGRMHALVLLVENSADVNTVADDGQSALLVASANGHNELATLLREEGANTDHEWMRLRATDIETRQLGFKPGQTEEQLSFECGASSERDASSVWTQREGGGREDGATRAERMCDTAARVLHIADSALTCAAVWTRRVWTQRGPLATRERVVILQRAGDLATQGWLQRGTRGTKVTARESAGRGRGLQGSTALISGRCSTCRCRQES
jgi:hypothetical protein